MGEEATLPKPCRRSSHTALIATMLSSQRERRTSKPLWLSSRRLKEGKKAGKADTAGAKEAAVKEAEGGRGEFDLVRDLGGGVAERLGFGLLAADEEP